jgi:two-component system response regulator AlgR
MTAAPCRTLIVDDEPLAIERLQILCADNPDLHLVGTASDGAAALRLVQALKPDLLFLDIAMPGMDGLEVARRLSAQRPKPAVIFVTAFDQFAVAAFDVAAVDYLLKPIAGDRLLRAVERARDALDRRRDEGPAANGEAQQWVSEFWVPHRAEIIRINARDIELIEAERDYMRLHVGARSFLLHQTITDLEQKLDPAMFIRLHRSTMARRDHIAGFKYDASGSWLAQMKDGKSVRIGRTYLANARAIAGR